jgi:hypothetical protein
MPALPSAASFTGSTVTEAQFKTALTDLIGYLALLGTTGAQADALTALAAPLHSVLAKSTAYTILAADRGKLINYSAAGVTCTLPTVAAAGAGFVVAIRNNAASGTLTIGRNSASIDGVAADISLLSKESVILVCDGTGWQSVGRMAIPAGLAFADPTTATVAGGWSFSVPAGARSALVEVWGANGGEGTPYPSGAGGGGGKGGYSSEVISLAGLSALSGTVGAGGAGGTTATQYAGSGGATTCTQTGQTANGGGGGQSSAYGGNGGAGGSASGGTTNISGAAGSYQTNSTYSGPTWLAPDGAAGRVSVQWRT